MEAKIPAGEKILQVLFGTELDVGANTATLVLTDRGIHAFTKKPLLKKIGSTHEIIPFRQITGITRYRKLLSKWILEVSRADNTDSYAYLDEMESETFLVTAQELISSQNDTKSEESADDVFAQLEKLTALFDKGILSENEFEAKKQELLKRI
ncbi:MAG: SHOCT domain-containing protein [Pontimonas sp.]